MMSPTTLSARVRRAESQRGFVGDLARAFDAQIYAFVRQGYCDLSDKHGRLPQAVKALRYSGDPADSALAQIIKEDIADGLAERH